MDADIEAALGKTPPPAAPAPQSATEDDQSAYAPLQGKLDQINAKMNQTGDLEGPDPDVQKALGTNAENVSGSWWAAMKTQMADPGHGWISKGLNMLTAGEQFVARQGINFLTSIKQMNPQDAKTLLSQEDAHGHDIMNYYYKSPTSFGSRVARFGLGLASDILLDPLTYLGVGAETEAAKSAVVAGETFGALDKMSAEERAILQASKGVEKVITANGALKDFESADEGASAARNNLDLLAQHANGEIGHQGLFDGLTGLAPGVKQDAQDAYAQGLKPRGFFDQWATGDRGLTIGAKIPFTNISKEIDVPLASYLTQPSGQMVSGLLNGVSRLATPILDSSAAKWFSNAINNTWTKTGFPVMDAAINKAIGLRNQYSDWAKNFSKESYAMLQGSNLEDVTNYIEKTVYDPALLAKGGKYAPDEALENSMTGGAKEVSQNIRKLNDKFLANEASRPGLHTEALNTNEEGAANAYLLHMVNDQWLEQEGRTANAVDYAYDKLNDAGMNVNKSSLGRSYRGYIQDANDISQGKSGVKMFVDDPVALTVVRGQRSVRATTNYDLLDTMANHGVILNDGDEVPQGYVKVQRSHLGSFETNTGQKIFDPSEEVKSSPTGYVWKRFVPPSITENEGKLFVPERIYNRVMGIVNQPQYGSFSQAIMDANSAFMRVFRNTALFGPGYLGMKMTSDMTTLLSNGSFSNPLTAMVDAVRAIHGDLGGEFQFADRYGNDYKLTQDQLFNMMLEHNVLRSNITKLAEPGDIAENIASTKQVREAIDGASPMGKASNFLDMVNLWRWNRGLTKFTEDIPKAALFIDRLRGGFTPGGAAEAAEKLFGNFSNQNIGARVLNNIFPFTSVALKTIEGKLSQLADGDLAHLAIPGKVQSALEGAFVPQKDVREELSSTLPGYLSSGMDRIHGPMLPGQQEILAEVPWVTNTLHFFGDPKENLHPALKLAATWATSEDEKNYNDITPKEVFLKNVGDTLGRFVPSWVKQGLQIAELNGVVNFGGSFWKSLVGQIGTSALGIDKLQTKVPREGSKPDSALVKQFNDANDLGKFFESHRDDDWLGSMYYRTFFPEKIDPENAMGNDLRILEERGKWVKQHFRDLTSGFATLTDMDKNVALNMSAMKRQRAKLFDDVKEDIAKQGYLPNADAFTDKEQLQGMSANNPKIAKALEISNKMDALHEYYNWYIHVDKTYGASNPWGLLFGNYSYSHEGKPEESWFKSLTPDEHDRLNLLLKGNEEEK